MTVPEVRPGPVDSIDPVPDADLPRRLNYGCGYDKREGYLNVDMDPGCQPDLLIVGNDLSALPRGWFEEIVAIDVLEHIPRRETPHILLEWADLLADGGRLHIQTSSIDGVARQLAKDPSFQSQYGWTHCLFGTQAQIGDFHLTGFTHNTLAVHLLAAGFHIQRMWVTGLWLLNAEATKASSWTSMLKTHRDVDDVQFVRAAYPEVLGREADESGLEYFVGELTAERLDRRGVLLHLMSSPERLFLTADRHGYGGSKRRPLVERVRPHIPNAWRPPLRAMYRTTRSASELGRRALGSVHGRRAVP